MITDYSNVYKNAVQKLIEGQGKCISSYQKYIFENYGDMFSECSFVYINDNRVLGYIGGIAPICKNKLHVFMLLSDDVCGNRIKKYLLERIVLYSNKNKITHITFSITPQNHFLFRIFRDLADRLNIEVKKLKIYSDDVHYEITYELCLDRLHQYK